MRNVIYPAILARSVDEFCRKIETAAMFAEGVQIDIMDGSFVPETTFQEAKRITVCKPGSLFYELHLMVEHPEKYIEPWENAADSYILHIETVSDPLSLIEYIRSIKKEVGLAISPATSVDVVLPYIPSVDTVLVMTVEPGKDGQRYIPEMEEKIRTLRSKFPKLPIEVDGGINEQTIVRAHAAGANLFVVGSAIWGRADGNDARGTFLALQKKLKK